MILVRGLALLLALCAGWAHALAPTLSGEGTITAASSWLSRAPAQNHIRHLFGGRATNPAQLVHAAQTGLSPGADQRSTEHLSIEPISSRQGSSDQVSRGQAAGLSSTGLSPTGLSTGPAQSLPAASTHEQSLHVIKSTVVVTLLLGLAIGALVLGSQDGEKTAPWMALIFTACALLIASTGGFLDILLGDDNTARGYWRFTLCYTALVWLPVGLLMLFRDTFTIHIPRAVNILTIVVPISLMAVLLLTPSWVRPFPKPLAAWLCFQYVFAYAVLFSACKQRRPHALIIALANTPLPFAMAYDYYQFFQNHTIEILTPYAIAFLIVVHGVIYTLKLGTAYRLAARLSTHLQEEVEQRTKELRDKNNKLEQAQTALQRANESLRLLSITDGLTQVHNRMYFEQQFEQEWRRCARQGLMLSILMIDADHFKKLNDSAGHLIGDSCLRAIAHEIQSQFKRAGELVARYGGEEFIVLLPDTNQNKAVAVAESLRIAIENLIVEHTDQRYRVTISIGVSTTTPALEQQASQLLATADAALYEAKEAGRNRVHSIPLLSARRVMAQQQLHL